METNQNLLREILAKVSKIEEELTANPSTQLITDEWISRQHVQEFFGYGDTQIAAFQKSGKVVFAKVGKRIFFQRKSLLEAIENSRVN